MAMGVTKQQGWLEDLVLFLNHTFPTEAKTNKRAFNRLFGSTGPIAMGLDLGRAGEPGKQLQQKLIQELGLIIEASDEQTFQSHLSALVQKINRLNLKTEYVVASGDQYVTDYDPSHQKTGQEPNPAYGQLGSGRRILKGRKGKAIVARLPWLRGNTPAEKLYEIILLCLLDGSFARLQRCPKLECRQFHIPKDLKRTYCSNECKVTSLNKKRLDNGYFKKRRANEKQLLDQEKERIKQQKLVQKFSTFLKKASGKDEPGSELALFIKKQLGGWRVVDGWIKEMENGKPAGQIWERLPRPMKDRLMDQLEYLK